MRKLLIGIVVLALFSAAGWYFVSPGMTLSAMRNAAVAGDPERLASHVDFPALRESLKQDLQRRSAAEMTRSKGAGGLEALGAAVGMRLAGGMVDTLVTPEGLRQLFAGGGLVKASGTVDLSPTSDHARIVRDDLNQFRVIDAEKPETGTQFVFRRRGFAWKLTEIRLPGDPAEQAAE